MAEENNTSSLKEAIEGLAPQQVLQAIEDGIDNILGPNSSKLVFKTLHLIYSFDKDAIPSNIERFDELISRMLGSTSAKVLRKQIILELERKRQ